MAIRPAKFIQSSEFVESSETAAMHAQIVCRQGKSDGFAASAVEKSALAAGPEYYFTTMEPLNGYEAAIAP